MNTDVSISKNTRAITVFAKMLAAEDIDVLVQNTDTAYFDAENRRIILPSYKDGLSESVTRLFTGHEVGHALYTPTDLKMLEETFKKYGNSIVQIVEDVRIENLVQKFYPGLKKHFRAGYAELLGVQFFGPNLPSRLFIDRFNIHMKVGAKAGVPFSAEERAIVTKARPITTWEQALEIMELLKEHKKEEQQKEKKSTPDDKEGSGSKGQSSNKDKCEQQSSDDQSEDTADVVSGGDECESQTAINKARRQSLEVTDNAGNIYVPKFDLNRWITPLKIFLDQKYPDTVLDEQYLNMYSQAMRPDIDYMAQLFNMRKNAKNRAMTHFQKIGDLDIMRIHEYSFNDDIFQSRRITPKSKNHGMVLFMDWSSSMMDCLYHSVVQLLCLTDFCQKIKIPFEVYSFTNDMDELAKIRLGSSRIPEYSKGDIKLESSSAILRHILSSKMSARDYKKMKTILLNVAAKLGAPPHRLNDSITGFGMSGTPLAHVCVLATKIVNDFRAEHKLDVVNTILVTDGDGSPLTSIKDQEFPGRNTYLHYKKYGFVGKFGDGRHYQIPTFLEMLEACTGSNVIGFYLCVDPDDPRIKDIAEYEKQGFSSTTEEGYSEFFIIKSEQNIMPEALHKNNKKVKRMLDRFIAIIT